MTTLKTPTTQTQAKIAIPTQTIEPPSAWIHQGTSPAELVLAVAYLLVAQGIVNWSIAGIIYALKSNKR